MSAVQVHAARGAFDMEHSTIQLETTDRRRLEEGGHA